MDFREIIDAYAETHNLSGTLLIAAGNKILHARSFGMADKSTLTPCAIDTQYPIASVTKQFTAVAVLKALYDKNARNGVENDSAAMKQAVHADLHRPIHHYLSQGPAYWRNAIPVWADTVTLHHLLTHSSGLPVLSSEDYHRCNSPENIAKTIARQALASEPGAKFCYANKGYALAGEILRCITGENPADYMEARFFRPLGMASTFMAVHGSAAEIRQSDPRASRLARNYGFDGSAHHDDLPEIRLPEIMERLLGSGNIISSAPDLLTWHNALYHGEILPEFLLGLMTEPHVLVNVPNDSYGYGIMVTQDQNAAISEIFSHTGAIAGFASSLTYLPLSKLSIICLSNVNEEYIDIGRAIETMKAALPADLGEEERVSRVDAWIDARYPYLDEMAKRHNLIDIDYEIIDALRKQNA